MSHLSYDFLLTSHLNLFSSTLNTSYRKSASFRSASMNFCVWDKDKSAGINEYPPSGNLTIMRNWQNSVYVEYENARWKSGHLRALRSKFQPKWLSFYKSKKWCLFFAIYMHFPIKLYEWALKLQPSWTEILRPLNRIKCVTAGVPHSACIIVLICNEHQRYTTLVLYIPFN